MSIPKLTYFDARARAELPRLLFALADVKFEDVRLARDKWPELKPKTPFGQIPMIEIDGMTLCQSLAISRYIARKYGFAGKDDKEAALMDMIVECGEDMIKPMRTFAYEKDEKLKAEGRKKYVEDQLTVYLKNLEKLLTANNDGNGYFVGDKISWADLCISHYIDTVTDRTGEAIPWQKYPKLKALKDRVEANPKIAAWLAKRP